MLGGGGGIFVYSGGFTSSYPTTTSVNMWITGASRRDHVLSVHCVVMSRLGHCHCHGTEVGPLESLPKNSS